MPKPSLLHRLCLCIGIARRYAAGADAHEGDGSRRQDATVLQTSGCFHSACSKPLVPQGLADVFGSFPPSPPAGVVEHVGNLRTQNSKPLHSAHSVYQHTVCYVCGVV